MVNTLGSMDRFSKVKYPMNKFDESVNCNFGHWSGLGNEEGDSICEFFLEDGQRGVLGGKQG